jgi:ElaA protein
VTAGDVHSARFGDVRSAGFAELSPATLYALLRLRVDIFVVEQACAYRELDGRDLEPATRHLWLEDGGAPVAYLRLLDEGGAHRIGRVATARSHRNQGFAARLMGAALASCAGPVVLDAQAYLVGWYEAFGFVAVGAEYLDDDGIAHVPMRLRRSRAPQT